MATTEASEKTVLPGIRPAAVRYIKLGEGGSWEKECLDRGTVRFGFGSANAQRFPLCARDSGML
jgi:hypothetical protein